MYVLLKGKIKILCEFNQKTIFDYFFVKSTGESRISNYSWNFWNDIFVKAISTRAPLFIGISVQSRSLKIDLTTFRSVVLNRLDLGRLFDLKRLFPQNAMLCTYFDVKNGNLWNTFSTCGNSVKSKPYCNKQNLVKVTSLLK